MAGRPTRVSAQKAASCIVEWVDNDGADSDASSSDDNLDDVLTSEEAAVEMDSA